MVLLNLNKQVLVIAFILVIVAILISMPNFMPIFGHLARRLCTMATGDAGIYSMAFITVPNIETGKALAQSLVSKKLAACVNIIPKIISVYEWEGKIEQEEELLLMIKTRTSLIDQLSDIVRKEHPYDCPEVISSKIDNGNPAYLKWIGEVVPEKKDT